MHDILIQGGTVIDGSGAPARQADVAVRNGCIAAVGSNLGPAQRLVDATGLLVTPGFVDIHTHYDGQATWDSQLTPSCWHGVTTAVFGNCGVGFAPVRPGARDYLINLMEGVEDIPGTVLAEGMAWSWESFPQYLDALEKRHYTMDIGAQLPHAALRFYAMGERGADHQQHPSAAELDQMASLAEQALHAGALGITTSRTIKHRARDGRFTPSLTAAEPELFAIAAALRRAGKGVLEVNSDFGEGDFAILRAACEAAGRPMSLLLLQVDNAPDLWRQTLDQIHEARAAGLDVTGQVGAKSIGVLFGFETSRNPFETHPAWAPLLPLTPRERVARLQADAALRERLVTERPDDALTAWFDKAFRRTFALGPQLDYEPEASQSLAARAQREGTTAWALALQALLADEGRGLLLHPFENYTGGDFSVVQAMLADAATVMGLGDAGAHVGLICDAAGPTYLLKHWARDRTRGPKLALEMLVKKQTADTARVYGLKDRGLLAEGLRADINVIDFDRLALRAPEVVYDLPTGGRRLLQRADGYRHTFVAGVEVLRDDALTGATPGRLIRG
ncbi:MAG TPA: amidohydrolase family protein [Aquabacterium sp.]|nr:amidohydrolase family protein [Aquabacterium sp.]HQC96555.1 amidohydrolase family protein [Aquabacterium sp.]